MAALTKSYEAYEKPGLVVSYKLAATALFKGGLVGLNSSGYLIPMAHGTASLKFAGVSNESIDNTGGSAGDRSALITKAGAFVFKAASGFSPAVSDLGKEVYANSDWEVQISASGLTNAYKVGTIVGIETTSTGTTGVRVRIDNYTL